MNAFFYWILTSSCIGSILLFSQSDVFDMAFVTPYFYALIFEAGLIILSSYCLSRSLRILVLPFLIINGAQFANFISTGCYIEPLTFQNLKSFRSIGMFQIMYLSTFFVCWLVFTFSLCLAKKSKTKFGIFCILPLCIFAICQSRYSPNIQFITSLKQAYVESRNSYEIKESTDRDKFEKVFRLSPPLTHSPLNHKLENSSHNVNFKTNHPIPATKSEQNILSLSKKTFGNVNFQSDQQLSSVLSNYNFNKDNLILIFLEGFSSEVIDKKLTPNLINLEGKGLDIKNYFSHTAATFRGIRGQLISGYQLAQGYTEDGKGIGQLSKAEIGEKFKNRPRGLPTIFNERGFKTSFISPHSNKDQLLQTMFYTGFQTGFGYEDFGYSSDMTDKQLFEVLLKESKKLENSQPFFICTYFFGTHHGLDSPDIKFGDGKNSYLNKFHNADYWLGNFIREFNKSSISKNTVIVITADHSTYPTPLFNKTFNLKKKYFVGRIPLIFYKKGMEPIKVDVDFRNSLSLAPTILDLYHFDNEKVSFLGKSIFSDDTTVFSRISALGTLFYLISPQIHSKQQTASIPTVNLTEVRLPNQVDKEELFKLFGKTVKNTGKVREDEIQKLEEHEIPRKIREIISKFYNLFG